MICLTKPSKELIGTSLAKLYIEQTLEELTTMLEDTTISVDELFMNADADFDAKNLHQLCHQKQIIANIAPNKKNTTDDN